MGYYKTEGSKSTSHKELIARADHEKWGQHGSHIGLPTKLLA
jgi:hypothetical protein